VTNIPLFINFNRLKNYIEILGEIGKTLDGGFCRLALTDEDTKAPIQVMEWMMARIAPTAMIFVPSIGRHKPQPTGSNVRRPFGKRRKCTFKYNIEVG